MENIYIKKSNIFLFFLTSMVLVFTGCPNNAADISRTKDTASDWLFLMYMAADNNLASSIWSDLNEAEYGLYKAQNKEKITVVALWDGGGIYNNSIPYGSVLYELAGDSSRNEQISAGTKDLSSTAPWLASGEVNTGSKETLVNFLNWAKERYSATNTVLVFSNHGGGPRSMSATNSYQQAGSRAMCSDDTSEAFLSTKDVSTAFDEAGYGTGNKLGMILPDVCLGASIEDAYQFRNYAQYLLASPNDIPANGMNYIEIIGDLEYSTTLETLGKKIVNDYKTRYSWGAEKWVNFLKRQQERYPGEVITDSAVGLYFSEDIHTLSFIDLSKMDELKTAFDEFSKELLLLPDVASLKRNFKTDRVVYAGTFTWLYDVGYLVQDVATKTTNDKLKTAAKKVESVLKTVILKSWRDGMVNNATYVGENQPYGLTICGETMEKTQSSGKSVYAPGYFPYFYTAEYLDFAGSGQWAQILQGWYPAEPKP